MCFKLLCDFPPKDVFCNCTISFVPFPGLRGRTRTLISSPEFSSWSELFQTLDGVRSFYIGRIFHISILNTCIKTEY